MKVLLRTNYASPSHNILAGNHIDVSEKEAVELVEGGFAEYCEATKVDVIPRKKKKANK